MAELTDTESSADHEATWLLGHTAKIDFGPLDIDGQHLVADAVLHVPCRFAAEEDGEIIRCEAHGFRGPVARARRTPADRKLGPATFELVERGKLVRRRIETPVPARKPLPLLSTTNPCATARCRTADNSVGMACCRDLQVEILCPPSQKRLELLIRHRQSPYLCKTSRESDDSLGVEMISACSYLEAGTGCSLHGRTRADGRSAKPDLCFEWPHSKDNRHPGCVF